MVRSIQQVTSTPLGGEFPVPWADLMASIARVRHLTMVPEPALIDLARLMQVMLTEGVPGAFVECGVWCGGASFLMADLLRQAGITDRKVWLLDSFQGMPQPTAVDGAAAMAWARTPNKPWYSAEVPLSLERVRENAAHLGLLPWTEFVQGWFDESLPAHRERIGPIAILRLDCDWYASVRTCLDQLYDQVSAGGFVVLDDYYTYDGCALAAHEFLSERRLAHRIESIGGEWEGGPVFHAARFRKGDPNWQWQHRLFRARSDLAAVVPPDARLILIDAGEFGEALTGTRPAVPFLEQDGTYWGAPADDETAISEFERLRQGGATFLAFAWSAFWWAEAYPRFLSHLRSRFHCALENERLIVFDLQAGPGQSHEAP